MANMAWRNIQQCVDKVRPHATCRWIVTLVLWIIYTLRVYYIQGFYIIAYGLGIYLLNLLIGFLSPRVDSDVLTRGPDAFKPCIRRLSEFAFRYSVTMAICIVFLMTFFPLFDIPHLWPIMFFYWILLTGLMAFSIITPRSDIVTSFLSTVLSNLTKDGEDQESF